MDATMPLHSGFLPPWGLLGQTATLGSMTDEQKAEFGELPDGPVTLDSLSQQMFVLLTQQKKLLVEQKELRANHESGQLDTRKRIERCTNHVLKLQQNVDPLTWKYRAMLTVAGSFAGGGVVYLLLRGALALAAAH